MKRLLALCVILMGAVRADDWTAFRGPHGDGRSGEKNPPLKWPATENVRWKVALPSAGNSNPVTWGKKLFLTQSIDPAGHVRALWCLDRTDGRRLWSREIRCDFDETTHKDNPFCSATPAVDGQRVVASFGSGGLVCWDIEGKELWRKDIGRLEHLWGNASSPIIHGDLVIANCGPGERQFLLALDKHTGREVWKVEEPGGKFGQAAPDWTGSWSTPVIARIDGKDQLLVSWPEYLRAYDPATGKLLWYCGGLTKLVYTSPMVGDGVVVAMSGYGGAAIGVRTGGAVGDVTASHRLWRVERNPQRIGSGVMEGGYLYFVNEPGIAQCIDPKTGDALWSERIGGTAWSSLTLADGKLYSVNMRGETVIFAARPQFEVLGRNALEERTLSTVVLSDGDLFIRTHQTLWCIRRGDR